MPRSCSRDDAGQVAAPLVIALTACLLSFVLVAQWGRWAGEIAQRQTQVDATALAVALAGSQAAEGVGGGADITVVGGRGRARAEARVSSLTVGATAVAYHTTTARRAGLAPAMVAVLARVEQLLGEPVVVVSGYRSPAAQHQLWERRHTNPYPVAAPGSSLHERGLAVDVTLQQVPSIARVAAQAGLCHPLPEIDPVHFVVCPIPE